MDHKTTPTTRAEATMNSPTQRTIFRWIHIIFAIPILGYIYSPFEKLPDYAPPTRYVFLPAMVLTGLWMWKGHLLRRLISTKKDRPNKMLQITPTSSVVFYEKNPLGPAPKILMSKSLEVKILRTNNLGRRYARCAHRHGLDHDRARSMGGARSDVKRRLWKYLRAK